MDDHQHKLSDWSYFTKAERRGVSVLVVGILVLVLLLCLFKYQASQNSVENDKAVQDMIAVALENQRKSEEGEETIFSKYTEAIPTTNNVEDRNSPIDLFEFDPNSASEADLRRLGLSNFVVSNLVKFRNKGTVFRTEKDLSRIYGLTEEKLAELAPYMKIVVATQQHDDFISLEEKQSKESRGSEALKIVSTDSIMVDRLKSKSPKVIRAKVDINNGTLDQLKGVHGIGDYYAQKILKYRDNLGGFHSTEQLSMIFNNRPELYTQIKDQVMTNGQVQKLNIKKMSHSELMSHYYVDYEIAVYLKNHMKFRDTLEIAYLKTDTFLDQSKIKWLIPYLITK